MPSSWLAVEAGTDLLARARQMQRSWDRLLGEGGLGDELSPLATAGLRTTIVESWRRSLATGLDSTELLAPVEADQPEVRERWFEHPLGQLAHVLAAQLRVVAEESRSLVVVSDASGLVLNIDGADWLKERAREMNLVEGARYSEMADGTNGVGTALAADHPLQVFAFEHFNQRHHEWICSGAPVHDPLSGRPVGLVDLSSLWKVAHPRSLELVTTAAKTVERCPSDIQRDQDARLRRRYGDLTTKSTDLLVNRRGYVLIGELNLLDHRTAQPEQRLPYPEWPHVVTAPFTSVPTVRSRNRRRLAACVSSARRSGAPSVPTSLPQSAGGGGCQAAPTRLRAAKTSRAQRPRPRAA